MINKKIKICFLIILPFLILMMIRNVYISCFVKVKTEYAHIELFNELIDSKALVLRNEKVLKNDSRFLKVICGDKSKIANGQTIAEVYDSESNMDPGDNYHNNKIFSIENINNKINKSIKDLIHKDSLNNNLDFLVKSKDLFLKGKLDLVQSGKNKTCYELNSDQNGYFSCFTDGFEENLNLNINDEDIKSINFNNYETNSNNDTSVFGKIVCDNKCFVLCILDKNIEIKNKKNKIYFQLNNEEIVCDLLKTIEVNDDKKIVVFCCDMNEFLINARIENVKIKLDSAEGIKISKGCLHEYDDQIGVFILDRKIVKFKPIDVTYDNGDFVMCNCGENIGELNQNDLIITSGNNLYDGKILMF